MPVNESLMNPASIDFRLLRSFVAVARAGSVTKAAARLHLTQPALSQHLRELGELTGIVLFDRVGRGIALTQAGADLFARLEPLLMQLDAVLSHARERAAAVRGELRIGAIDTYARALVIPAVADLIAEHAELNVSVHELPAAAIDRALIDNELDIGIAFSHLSNPDIEQRRLFEEPLCLIEKMQHTGGRGVTLEEVAARQLVLLNRDFAMRQQIDDVFARAELALDVRAEVANVDSMIRFANTGRFAAIASRLALPRESGLAHAMIGHAGMSRIAALRWRRGRTFSPMVDAFERQLQTRINAMGMFASTAK